MVAGLCRNREPIGDKVSFSLYTSRYVYFVTARYFVVVVCLFSLWEDFSLVKLRMFVAEYGSQSFFLSIFSNQRVLLAKQQCQTRIRLIIFMCMIWPFLGKKLAIIGSTSPPGLRGSPLSSMRSKPFCAV